MSLKLYDKKKFSAEVKDIVEKTDSNYMEAIMENAARIGLDIDRVSKLLTPELKNLLYEESQDLNRIPKKTESLEFDE